MNINATHHTTPRKDNKLSKISTTYFVKRPVVPANWITPNKPPGCCSLNFWTDRNKTKRWKPSWRASTNLTTSDFDTLQNRTFYGKEKKSLASAIAIMNTILNAIEVLNIIHTNTLAVQDKDRYDVVLANPLFGGKERKEVQQNFPIRTGETKFLPLFIHITKLSMQSI